MPHASMLQWASDNSVTRKNWTHSHRVIALLLSTHAHPDCELNHITKNALLNFSFLSLSWCFPPFVSSQYRTCSVLALS